MVDETFNSIVSSQPKSQSHLLPPPMPMLRDGKGIADSIVFLPVTKPVDSRLNPDRAETINHVDVEAMNSGLLARLLTSHTSGLTPSTHTTAPVVIPTVLNDLLVPSETDDGLHYSDKIVKKQAEILLSYRCNDMANEMSGACCRREKRLTIMQVVVLFFVCAWAPLSILLRSKATSESKSMPGRKWSWQADRLTRIFIKNSIRRQEQPPARPPQSRHAVRHLRYSHPLPLPGRPNQRVLEGTETVQRMDV